MRELVVPDPLSTTATVAVVSLSSNVPALVPRRLQRGIDSLRGVGFQVREATHLADSRFPSTETIASRLSDLHHAYAGPASAVFSAIGGWASHQILESIDDRLVRDSPRWFIGYSDVTSVHLHLLSRVGVAGVYGPAILPQFGEPGGVDGYTLESLLSATRGLRYDMQYPAAMTASVSLWDIDDDRPRARTPYAGPTLLRPGTGSGPTVAANLETLLTHAGTETWPDLKDRLLFIEISDAASDTQALRLIHQLSRQPYFRHLAGLAFGSLAPRSPIDAAGLYARALEISTGTSFPIVANLPFGHVDPMASIPVGVPGRLSASSERVTVQFY